MVGVAVRWFDEGRKKEKDKGGITKNKRGAYEKNREMNRPRFLVVKVDCVCVCVDC